MSYDTDVTTRRTTDTWVLMSIRLAALGYIPKLPLRILPDEGGREASPLLAKDCKEWDGCRGWSSRVLELLKVLATLPTLDVELRAGVRDGSGSSPPRTSGRG
jgi:hypothetical protein